MLIDALKILSVVKKPNGFDVEIELDAEDGASFSGNVFFDSNWEYDFGFLGVFVNTDSDKDFVFKVFSSDDFKNDVRAFVRS